MKKPFIIRFVEACEARPNKIAMRVVGDESEVFSFGDFLDQVRRIAYRLKKVGVSRGDRIAIIGENHPAWAIAYLGILYRGAIAVPLDPHGEIETLANFLEDSKTKIAFISSDMLKTFSGIQKKIGRKIPTVVWRNTSQEDDIESFENWTTTEIPGESEDLAPNNNLNDIAVLMYTSGTTGKPKGVPLTHKNITAELDAINNVLEFTEKESVLSLLPLFHSYLQLVNLWLASTKGAEVFYIKELTPDELSKAMYVSKMTGLASVPRLWYLFHKKIFDTVATKPAHVRLLFSSMLRVNGFARNRFGVNFGKQFFRSVHSSFGGNLRLAVSAGSRFDSSVAIDFHRLGFTILQGYGLTETSGAATATHEKDNRVGSVGKPMLGTEIKIDAPNNNGEGEVLIRGDLVFEGYYNNPEATKAAFTEDGWFRSGDLGRLDSDGNLYIVGRAKDVIVLPSGKNVHPEDLEVHFSKSPLIAEICVLGIEDENIGHAGAEKLVAVIIPDFEYFRQNSIVNSKEAIRFELDKLGRDLPEYQRVRECIIRVNPLPRTATRKIKRFEILREIAENRAEIGESAVPAREISTSENALMNTEAARIVIDSIREQKPIPSDLHPNMNLELDLHLDSLSRAEIIASLEQTFEIEFDSEQVAKALTIGELTKLIRQFTESSQHTSVRSTELNWNKILNSDFKEPPEIRSSLKSKPIIMIGIFLILRGVYLFCKIFLRMEITGKENLSLENPPYLICPNHQSFLDPFVICSVYPYRVLKKTFHVGASEFFKGHVSSRIGRWLNIVPINADTHLLKAMKAGAYGLKHGRILNIYPEGERGFDGHLHPFKNGAAILASELDLDIMPVTIDGLYKVWARGTNRIRFAKIKLDFGEPFRAKSVSDSKNPAIRYDAITATLKERIAAELSKMRT